jgi:Domain of unknown function (DUF6883)
VGIYAAAAKLDTTEGRSQRQRLQMRLTQPPLERPRSCIVASFVPHSRDYGASGAAYDRHIGGHTRPPQMQIGGTIAKCFGKLWTQMKLPSASQLIVERDKISEYLLNPLHRYGAAKERFFTIFGFRADSWQILAEALCEHGRTHNIVRAHETGFGMRYIVEGELNTPLGRRPRVRTVWQFDEGTIAPRLITAYPLEDS